MKLNLTNKCTNITLHLPNAIIAGTNQKWRENGQKHVDRWIKELNFCRFFLSIFYQILINVSVTYQDALKEAEKKQAEIKPINFFKAESRLNLRKPSIYPTPIEDDVSSLENCNSTSFFCINTLGDSFGSTKDLKPVRRDSLELESEADKSFKRKSKRKHFFRANSVDDSMFK